VKTLFKKKSRIGLGMGQEWLMSQNVNAYYRFLGAYYFS
jgi:hypothetical protein